MEEKNCHFCFMSEFPRPMDAGADFSRCGTYRYGLWRRWDTQLPQVLFVMLNPSTANATHNDPTIRRCINFAASWGFGGLYVGNLFAYRATRPNALLEADDPVGPENAYWLALLAHNCSAVVAAWGNAHLVDQLLTTDPLEGLRPLNLPMYAIAFTKAGTPKHPLYLRKESLLLPISR